MVRQLLHLLRDINLITMEIQFHRRFDYLDHYNINFVRLGIVSEMPT